MRLSQNLRNRNEIYYILSFIIIEYYVVKLWCINFRGIISLQTDSCHKTFGIGRKQLLMIIGKLFLNLSYICDTPYVIWVNGLFRNGFLHTAFCAHGLCTRDLLCRCVFHTSAHQNFVHLNPWERSVSKSILNLI